MKGLVFWIMLAINLILIGFVFFGKVTNTGTEVKLDAFLKEDSSLKMFGRTYELQAFRIFMASPNDSTLAIVVAMDTTKGDRAWRGSNGELQIRLNDTTTVQRFKEFIKGEE